MSNRKSFKTRGAKTQGKIKTDQVKCWVKYNSSFIIFPVLEDRKGKWDFVVVGMGHCSYLSARVEVGTFVAGREAASACHGLPALHFLSMWGKWKGLHCNPWHIKKIYEGT